MAKVTSLKMPVTFDIPRNIRVLHIMLLGCGGNGSYVIRDLARLLAVKTLPETAYLFTICDGDVVEAKNITRQNFINADIGKNKAEVLAKRYSKAFDIPIGYVPEYIEDSTQLENLTGPETDATLVIGCLDNAKARGVIRDFTNKQMSNRRMSMWLDCGNEEYAGQIVFWVTVNSYPQAVFIQDGMGYKGYFSLPLVSDIYPDIVDDNGKFASELSCDDRAVSAPQSIATNITAGTLMFNTINSLLNGTLNYHHITFNSKMNNYTTHFITEELAALHKNRVNPNNGGVHAIFRMPPAVTEPTAVNG